MSLSLHTLTHRLDSLLDTRNGRLNVNLSGVKPLCENVVSRLDFQFFSICHAFIYYILILQLQFMTNQSRKNVRFALNGKLLPNEYSSIELKGVIRDEEKSIAFNLLIKTNK